MPNINAAKNLKPWKPGQSGNPTGKRKHSVIRYIEEALGEQVRVRNADGTVNKLSKAKFLGTTLVRLAIKLLNKVEAEEEMDHNVLLVYRDCLAYVLKNADPEAILNKAAEAQATTELIVKTETGALFAHRAAALHALNGKLGPAQILEAFRQAKRDEMELAKQEAT